MKNLIVFLVLALTGCVSRPLTNEEQSVRILRKSAAPMQCNDLGKIEGKKELSSESAELNLKRAAFKLGANLATLDSEDKYGTVFGTAFRCP